MLSCQTCIRLSRSARTIVGSSSSTRSFSRSSLLLAKSAKPFKTQAAAPVAVVAPAASGSKLSSTGSSCPAGTRITGLNYIKTGADPIALEDNEYPAWLWTLMGDSSASTAKKSKGVAVATPEEELRQSRKLGRAAIKAKNSFKG